MSERRYPDFLFETSWEVCNKVGGIHTVLATKALSIAQNTKAVHVVLGPDIARDRADAVEFQECETEFAAWADQARQEGFRLRIGKWQVPGSPIAILVDFTTLTPQKDEILTELWEIYQLDSIQGQWDYIEPLLFGYACGKLIEHFVRHNLSPSHHVVSQWHEWMTGAGLLYLKKNLPQVGTVFTTHATVLGRCIAGNGLPLYDHLDRYEPLAMAREFNVVSKNSLETIAAQEADVYTAVSELTGKESIQFHKKPIDLCTPNGFEATFVPSKGEFELQRIESRMRLLEVAEAVLGYKIPMDALLVATSGRFEFKNKGLDVFIDALAKIRDQGNLDRPIVAFMLIPSGHHGPRRDVMGRLSEGNDIPLTEEANPTGKRTTHYLSDPDNNPILQTLNQRGFDNNEADKIKVVYVPCYLNGHDGVVNMEYYRLLIGLDLTVFASYYEPWGYTPLESLAFHVPTVTTSLTGFGLWARDHSVKHEGRGLTVIDRNDANVEAVRVNLAKRIETFATLSSDNVEKERNAAFQISEVALWDKLVREYFKAYDICLEKVEKRIASCGILQPIKPHRNEDLRLPVPAPNWQRMLVVKSLPKGLEPLDELAHNLWWVWHPEAEKLFASIDPELWEECEHNPIMLLERSSYRRLEELAKEKEFITRLNGIMANFKRYMEAKPDEKQPSIAYFSMEYGLHASLKLYSGGLGVLAGDYLKEASDRNVKMVAIGLFYRYGYFTQKLSHTGQQIASYNHQNFTQTLAQPVRDEEGKWLTVSVGMPGREVKIRVWLVRVGRIALYLLDTDFEENMEQDRSITYHLYGGDQENRFKQEMVLGIGGMRALEAMGARTELLHLNEGHAAFAGLERLRILMLEDRLSFEEALELVRATSLFTTHTPVPAGHDRFEEALVRTYMAHYPERFTISWDRFISFGRIAPQDTTEKFSMSNLAANFSCAVNGVSELHGKVSQNMFAELWPGYFAQENHVGYVTNGVHYPTWIADLWRPILNAPQNDDELPQWDNISRLDDEAIWNVRCELRSRLIETVADTLVSNEMLRVASAKSLLDIRDEINPKALTIGFARRFATYKRAHLLFTDLERLKSIVNNPEMPVQFLFAGKAHPHDGAGQDLIKKIFEISQREEFRGKILFLPNYDMNLAHLMVQGVDIWLNTPTWPQEASGTSGMKAVMNGSLHFSVLDGWWPEGYEPGAGWALGEVHAFSQSIQDELDAGEIYSKIEDEIAPMFYKRNGNDVPVEWVDCIRRSMTRVAPKFASTRMMADYYQRFYNPLRERLDLLSADGRRPLFELVAWKQHMLRCWNSVQVIRVERIEMGQTRLQTGTEYTERVIIDTGLVSPEYVGLELLMVELKPGSQEVEIEATLPFEMVACEGTRSTFEVRLRPDAPGAYDAAIRLFAKHPLLPHRMDFNLMRWV